MLVARSLTLVLAATLPFACSPSAKSGKSDKTQSKNSESSGSVQPFAYTDYPDEARTDSGRLGAAANGTLIAASTDAPVEISSTWQNGPSIVVFYRGHW